MGLRMAMLGDLNFIFEQIVEGSKHGHFEKSLQHNNDAAMSFMIELNAIIVGKKRPNGEQAVAMIYESDNRPVGFCVLTGSTDVRYTEIWLLGVHQDFRGRGFGSALVDDVLACRPWRDRVFARCAPTSTLMYAMLRRRGFRQVATSNSHFRILSLTR